MKKTKKDRTATTAATISEVDYHKQIKFSFNENGKAELLVTEKAKPNYEKNASLKINNKDLVAVIHISELPSWRHLLKHSNFTFFNATFNSQDRVVPVKVF